MFDRIESSKALLKDRFVYTIAIDEIEQELLGQIIKDAFPNNKKYVLPSFTIREVNREKTSHTLMNMLLWFIPTIWKSIYLM